MYVVPTITRSATKEVAKESSPFYLGTANGKDRRERMGFSILRHVFVALLVAASVTTFLFAPNID